MTHKNQVCSGLKATHFVWEIRWGILSGQSYPFPLESLQETRNFSKGEGCSLPP